MMRLLQRFRAKHRIASQVALGVLLALGYNVLPTLSAPTPPIVYPLRWYQQATGTDDTPGAPLYTRAASQVVGNGATVSAIAYPASGTEAAPGAFLRVTAAGEDSSQLRFHVILNGVALPAAGVLGVNPPARGDSKFQTAKLTVELPATIGEHSVAVRVTTVGGTPRTAETPTITVVDPREEIRRELSQLKTLGGAAGYTSIDAFLAEMGPVIERAQADFRIHGWGDAGEQAYYAGNSPVSYGLPNTGVLPYFLDGRGSLRGGDGELLNPAPDVSGTLLRLQPWVTAFAGPPTAADEASGEYFAALLNAEAGRVGLSNYADLLNAPATVPGGLPLPEIYKRSTSGPGCFPRQNMAEFLLPDQLFFGTALDALKVAPFSQLGELPQPVNGTTAYQDLADMGRLFNDQTANLFSPATDGTADVPHGARHAPHVPRVRVFASIRDGYTKPLVFWTFSDAKCGHTQASVTVTPAGTPNGSFSRILAAVPASVKVEVFDEDGFSADRTVFVQP